MDFKHDRNKGVIRIEFDESDKPYFYRIGQMLTDNYGQPDNWTLVEEKGIPNIIEYKLTLKWIRGDAVKAMKMLKASIEKELENPSIEILETR